MHCVSSIVYVCYRASPLVRRSRSSWIIKFYKDGEMHFRYAIRQHTHQHQGSFFMYTYRVRSAVSHNRLLPCRHLSDVSMSSYFCGQHSDSRSRASKSPARNDCNLNSLIPSLLMQTGSQRQFLFIHIGKFRVSCLAGLAVGPYECSTPFSVPASFFSSFANENPKAQWRHIHKYSRLFFIVAEHSKTRTQRMR